MSELKTILTSVANHVEVQTVTPAGSQPVDLATCKSYAGITTSADDIVIQLLLDSAILEIENWLRRSLITRTLKAIFNGEDQWKEIPFSPVTSITEVKSIDSEGNETTFTSTEYQVSGSQENVQVFVPQVMTLRNGRAVDRVEITYESGYDAASVPAPIRKAILELVAMSYNMRDTINNVCVSIETAPNVKATLRPYKNYWI